LCQTRKTNTIIKFTYLTFLGTSNWAEDYFTDTAGICVVIEPEFGSQKPNLLTEMEEIFQRDWNSELARRL
jgi:phospholipase D3/4